MSFIIAIYVGEGIVLASDSRTTYNTTINNKDGSTTIQLGTHFTDTAYKTFCTPKGVGISTCGNASINGIPIASFIERFIDTNQDLDVIGIKDNIVTYFNTICPDLDTVFFVAGYSVAEGKAEKQKLYRITTIDKKIEEIDTEKSGAIWDGETNVMSRILSTLYLKKENGNYIQHSQYNVLWNYFTLQDAIDFARYAVQTTIDTMKFQERVKTVGGPVDILVIKPQNSVWICRKQLG